MIFRRIVFIGMSILLLVGLSLPLACAKPAPAPTPKPAPTPAPKPELPKALIMSTTRVGGALQVYGATGASIIEKYTGVVVTPRTTTGGLEAAQVFAKGESQMVATDGYSTLQLYTAEREPYIPSTEKIRVLSGAYKSAVHFIVRADSGIKTIADLKGKRCGFIRPKFPLWLDVYKAVINAYGLTDDDIEVLPALGYADAAAALREGKFDATLQYSAPPMPMIKELEQSHPVRVLSIDKDKEAAILKAVPYEFFAPIKAGTYKGQTEDINTLWIPSFISMEKSLPEEFGYLAAKALVEHFDEIQAAHALFKTWKPADLASSPNAPFHPGAIKYYKEAGLLSPEAEKRHNELLKKMNQKS